MENSFDEILSLVSQTKRDLYQQIGDEKQAKQAHIQASRQNLDAAIGAAREGKFREALRLLKRLQSLLQENDMLKTERNVSIDLRHFDRRILLSGSLA